MPFVSGFLRVRRRRPGGGGPVDPDYGIEGPAEPGQPLPPDEEGPVDPDYGIEGPEVDPPSIWPSPGRPSHPIYLPKPKPPVGIWPPPTPSHPIVPVPPGNGNGGEGGEHPAHPIAPGGEYPSQLPSLPPGMIWPPPNAAGKFVVLAWIPGMGWKYFVIDASLKPSHPIAPGGGDPAPTPQR